MQLLAGTIHAFPRGLQPRLSFERVAARPALDERDKKLAELGRAELAKDPLGDGMKLSVMGLRLESPSDARIEVGNIRFSQICGAIEATAGLESGEAAGSFSSKGIRVLLSNNILICDDERIVLSVGRDGRPKTPLNGFVDSATMEGRMDTGLIARTAATELLEEYGIGSSPGHEIHSIHVTASRSLPLAVRVFGSVRLPLSFEEIKSAKEGAPDAWENPMLIAIENSKKAIDALARTVPEIGPMLLAYAARVL